MTTQDNRSQQSQDPLADLANAVSGRSADHQPLPTASAASGANPYAAGAVAVPQTSLTLSVVGAALGAGVGALIWFLIQHFTGYMVGWIAILVGALAGWGAVMLGKRRDFAVGVIAALAGVAGIFLGSYFSFWTQINSASAKQELVQFLSQDPEAAGMSHAELMQAADELCKSVSYVDWVQADPKSMAFLAFFGALGLYYGYRVGSGTRRASRS